MPQISADSVCCCNELCGRSAVTTIHVKRKDSCQLSTCTNRTTITKEVQCVVGYSG